MTKATNTKPLFDYHHHKHNWSDNSTENLKELVNIWEGELKVHLSSGETRSHEDYIKYEDYKELIKLMKSIEGIVGLDVMLECKQKNKALIKLRRDCSNV